MKRLLWALLAFVPLAFADTPISITLLHDATATGSALPWPGGVGVFSAVASSWNSATVTLEFLGPDGSTFVSAGSNTTCTANCAGVFYLPPGQIKAVISGSPTAVYASASQVQTP